MAIALVLPISARAQGLGVTVEAVESGSVGQKLGLRAGDRLTGWRRRSGGTGTVAARGTFESPFDVTTFELNVAPRRGVELLFRRGHAALISPVPPGRWGVLTRPALEPNAQVEHDRAGGLTAAAKVESAVSVWRALSDATRGAHPILSCWFLWRAGDALDRANKVDDAVTAFGDALSVARSLNGRADIEAQLLYSRAAVRLNRRQVNNELAGVLAESARAWERAGGRGLAWAWTQARYAMAVPRGGESSPSTQALRAALGIQERLAPRGYPTAQTYNQLARNFGSVPIWERTRAILVSIAPDSTDLASVINGLAVIAAVGGNHARADVLLDEAEGVYRRAVRSGQFQLPLDEAIRTLNRGNIARARGDLARAEELFLQALTTFERVSGDSAETAGILANLGGVAIERGDMGMAAEWHERSEAISERISRPDSLEYAIVLSNRVGVHVRNGQLDRAEATAREAANLRRRLDAGNHLGALNTLAERQLAVGHTKDARATVAELSAYKDRLTLGQRAAFNEVSAALEEADGNLLSAEQYLQEAIRVRTGFEPNKWALARAYQQLARVMDARGDDGEALANLMRATEVVEHIRTRLGGSEQSASAFGLQVASLYEACIDLLVRLGRHAEAFSMLERSHARAFLLQVAQRDLLFQGDIPETLRTQRLDTERALDEAEQQLSRPAGSTGAASVAGVQAKIRRLQTELNVIKNRIRLASPRLASLQYPSPFTLTEARRALEPGVALVAFSVGRDRTHGFVVRPDGRVATPSPGLHVFTVARTRHQLQAAVSRLRAALEEPGDASAVESFRRDASSLYRQLLGPVEPIVEPAARLLIVADGPLHRLPFAALVRDVSRADGYVINWKPVTMVASTTVYAQLKRPRVAGDSRGALVVAFGDPDYGSNTLGGGRREFQIGDAAAAPAGEPASDDPEKRMLLRAGVKLAPLPSTRDEARAVARLYQPRAVAYLGGDVSETRARSLPRNTRIVHFGVHAVVNDALPLNSALVLSTPAAGTTAADNGLLQVWEILDRVRLDAELVTLSACDTALGRDSGGEGLLGLTRAFHFAGARAVLATLWRVDDRATAELMHRFYTNLRAGLAKDDALRQAQATTARQPGRQHPFYWAAFTLSGTWDPVSVN